METHLWRHILSFITFSPDPQYLLSVCPTGPASSWPSEFRSESQSDPLFSIIHPDRSGNHFFGILLHMCQCSNMQPPPRKVRSQRSNNEMICYIVPKLQLYTQPRFVLKRCISFICNGEFSRAVLFLLLILKQQQLRIIPEFSRYLSRDDR